MDSLHVLDLCYAINRLTTNGKVSVQTAEWTRKKKEADREILATGASSLVIAAFTFPVAPERVIICRDHKLTGREFIKVINEWWLRLSYGAAWW